MASAAVENDLTCSICLDLFDCPTTLSCGHSFCLQCLEDACKSATLSVQAAAALANGDDKVMLTSCALLGVLQRGIKSIGFPQTLSICDICVESFMPPTKSRVVLENVSVERCLILCLNPQSPSVVDSVSVNSFRWCGKHGKPVQMFCTLDHALICTACTVEGEHRSHNVITLEREKEARKALLLRNVMDSLSRYMFSVDVTIHPALPHTPPTQESTKNNKAKISSKYTWQRKLLDEEERAALKQLEDNGALLLCKIQNNINSFERELQALQQSKQKLKELLFVEDPIDFLQGDARAKKNYKAHYEILRKNQFLALLAFKIKVYSVALTGHRHLQGVPFTDAARQRHVPLTGRHGRSPTLNSNTAHSNLKLSADLRTAKRVIHSQRYAAHPSRFDCWLQALCSQAFSSGRHYLEVDVGGSDFFFVGVACETIPRKGHWQDNALGGSKSSWVVGRRGVNYIAAHGDIFYKIEVRSHLRRVGVYLEWESGLLSFYNTDTMDRLHLFSHKFVQPLHPGLYVGAGQVTIHG
uniref:Uncharacterized protein n=1 Tax=Petromyzon marinus TaxID=7757 RepID=S4R8Y1_PETMA